MKEIIEYALTGDMPKGGPPALTVFNVKGPPPKKSFLHLFLGDWKPALLRLILIVFLGAIPLYFAILAIYNPISTGWNGSKGSPSTDITIHWQTGEPLPPPPIPTAILTRG